MPVNDWPYVIFERGEMKEIIQGASISAEMQLRGQGSRIGHEHRTRAKAHVQKMLDLGYLKGDDAGARVNYIEKAETSAELSEAIRDLPALPAPRSMRPDWSNPSFFTPVFILTSVLSVLFAASPFIAGVLMGFFHKDAIMTALGVPCIIIGILGLGSSISACISKLDAASKAKKRNS